MVPVSPVSFFLILMREPGCEMHSVLLSLTVIRVRSRRWWREGSSWPAVYNTCRRDPLSRLVSKATPTSRVLGQCLKHMWASTGFTSSVNTHQLSLSTPPRGFRYCSTVLATPGYPSSYTETLVGGASPRMGSRVICEGYDQYRPPYTGTEWAGLAHGGFYPPASLWVGLSGAVVQAHIAG